MNCHMPEALRARHGLRVERALDEGQQCELGRHAAALDLLDDVEHVAARAAGHARHVVGPRGVPLLAIAHQRRCRGRASRSRAAREPRGRCVPPRRRPRARRRPAVPRARRRRSARAARAGRGRGALHRTSRSRSRSHGPPSRQAILSGSVGVVVVAQPATSRLRSSTASTASSVGVLPFAKLASTSAGVVAETPRSRAQRLDGGFGAAQERVHRALALDAARQGRRDAAHVRRWHQAS